LIIGDSSQRKVMPRNFIILPSEVLALPLSRCRSDNLTRSVVGVTTSRQYSLLLESTTRMSCAMNGSNVARTAVNESERRNRLRLKRLEPEV